MDEIPDDDDEEEVDEPAESAETAAPTPAAPATPTPPPPPPPPAQDDGAASSRVETREAMTRMRTTIAKRLKESRETAASLTTFNEIDMTNLIDMRNRHKDDFLKV